MKYPNITLGRVEAVWNKLGGDEGVQCFLSGASEVVIRKHLINCDADPYVPNGWSVEEHQKGGQLQWNKDAQKDALYLSDKQKSGSIVGNKLRTELKGKPVLNANVLDYLLAHPHLISEEWKEKYVFFWGTIYRGSHGDLCVRFLYWHEGGWRWSYHWLVYVWYADDPAAVFAS
ncbi:MAG: hypothetical protein Q8R36_03025 [bacterium]|nr:hypothetical protein [bacterium]